MRQSRPAPTLQDVAARSGVSTATVSRCLNAPEQVAEATRTKVMNAVRDLGYSPHFGARVMAARRTRTIGAVIPTMENAIFARGLQAFQEELGTHGYMMLVASSSYREDLEEEQARALVARGAEGLLLIGHRRDAGLYDFFEAQGVPALVTWAYDPAEPHASVGFDNRKAMAKLTTAVLDRGHRKLALISAPVENNDRALERMVGTRSAMQAAGLDPETLTVIETPYSIENGATAMARIHETAPEVTAILCGNDVLAVGALNQARKLGLSVPDDISITGFDDIELAEVAYPALATVHVPHREMGRNAARLLVGALEHGAPLRTLELDATLRLRASLGIAPNR